MRIGILTYHGVSNEGSVLQALSLWTLLSRRFPKDEVEIIDYIPWRTWSRNLKPLISPKVGLRKKLYALGKLRQLRSLLRRSGALGPRIWTSDRLGPARKALEKAGYDTLVVGSDTVWEVREDGFLPPPPNLFFLPDVRGVQKMGFAASSDKGRRYQPGDGRWDQLGAYLRDFDFVSVRDEETRRMLIDCGVEADEIRMMADPTLLSAWEGALEHESCDDGPQAVGKKAALWVFMPEFSRALRNGLEERGYEVVDLTKHWTADATGRSLFAPLRHDLWARIRSIRSQSVLFTDRFHGSILTMKTSSVPVVFVEHAERYPNSSSKGRDLFERLDLTEWIWRAPNERHLDGREFSRVCQLLESESLDPGFRRSALLDLGRASEPVVEEVVERIESARPKLA